MNNQFYKSARMIAKEEQAERELKQLHDTLDYANENNLFKELSTLTGIPKGVLIQFHSHPYVDKTSAAKIREAQDALLKIDVSEVEKRPTNSSIALVTAYAY